MFVDRKGKLTSRLWDAKGEPLMRVPNLAIHLTDRSKGNAFDPNKETHIKPVFSQQELNEGAAKESEILKHPRKLLEMIAKDLEIKVEDIVDIDLNLCDAIPGQLIGANKEFLSVARLDNQASCFTAVDALLEQDLAS